MNKINLPGVILFLVTCSLIPKGGFAQITSGANSIVPTEYSSGNQDNINVFCGQKEFPNGSLTASFSGGESGTFEWTKYNAATGTFNFFSSDLSGNPSSTISNLQDGCYRVSLTSNSVVKIFTAWVFNDYITTTAEIPESDCTSFTLKGTLDSPIFIYIDLTTGQPRDLNKDIKVEWSQGNSLVSRVIITKVYTPPTRDTDYTFEVSDKFGCTSQSEVQYQSIVTKASFDYKLDDRKSDIKFDEAPLTATFTNTSENGDAGKFEWFIFKDLQKIKEEKEAGTFKDSILEIIYSDNPIYIFEETGQYKVKLVSKKVSLYTTCTDTFYIDGYIDVHESFLDAPNVFTPDGNDVNEKFAVKFISMKTVKITIFNRWGKIMHVWESNNVRGFYNTASDKGRNYDVQSVWDGKVGGRLATPGVYYYVADGIGRDGIRRKANGFFHLFRGK